MNVVWWLVVWFGLGIPPQGELHIFATVEACQTYRATYLAENGDNDVTYVISRCKPKELE